MADSEAARSVHQVEYDDKSNSKSLTDGEGGAHYRRGLTAEQEEFLNNVAPEEQDRIYRKV